MIEPKSDTFIVTHENLVSALALLPLEQKGEFTLRLFGLHETSSGDASPELSVESAPVDSDEFWSVALTVEQARELAQKVDKATLEIIRAALRNEKDGVATVDWSDVKRITGVDNWSQFARGRLGGLHRSVNAIIGKPGSTLIWWERDGWVEDGQGDYSNGTLGIDGPAVRALKVALSV